MAVMEYIPKSRGQSIVPLSVDDSPPPPQVIHRDITKALQLQDLVFGDLQETNVLYLPEDGGHPLLVDFDGVGRDGIDGLSVCLDSEARAGFGVDR